MLEEALTRGSHLKLAQRHHKITAGQLHGECLWEANKSSPGITGAVHLRFTTTGKWPLNTKLFLKFPLQHGWKIPNAPNVTVCVQPGIPLFSIDALWKKEKNTLEFCVLETEVESNVSIELILSGITTPETATSSETLYLSVYEPEKLRNTTPASTRGGQLIDGPTSIVTSKITPGSLHGALTWTASNFTPSISGDVSLQCTTMGSLPENGILLVEIPQDGWHMEKCPQVLLKVAGANEVQSCPATWDDMQHSLSIQMKKGLKMQSKLSFTIKNVMNPNHEVARGYGHVTTLDAVGKGVIDGPTKIAVSRISQLTESAILKLQESFIEKDPENTKKLDIAFLPELLDILCIRLDETRFQALVLDKLPESAEEPEENDNEKSKSFEIETLINIVTDLYRPSNKYGNALRIACRRNEMDNVTDLIQRGCDVNSQDGAGWSGVHHAASYGNTQIITLLHTFSNDLWINAGDTSGWTPLHCAAANGHKQTVVELLQNGALINAQNKQGRTALHVAASKGMDAIVATLLMSKGIEKSLVDNTQSTALHGAALHASVGAIKLLVELGINREIKDMMGYDWFHYCDSATKVALKSLLLKLEKQI